MSDEQEDEVLSPLFDGLRTCRARDEFVKRLRTFHPSTYFAKPVPLSPIICARFGWTNPLPDMLVCDSCEATLAITFHPRLKSTDVRRITSVYRSRLCNAHKLTCPFFANKSPSLESTCVPAYLATVLPDDMVNLMEHPAPHKLLYQRTEAWRDAVGRDATPELEMPLSNKLFKDFVGEENGEETLSARVAQACGIQTTDQSLAILALFGWEPAITTGESVSDSSAPLVLAECKVCLAEAELTMPDTQGSDDSDVPPPTKKQRRRPMNPLMSHRYYCPIVCGFSTDSEEHSSVPMWRVIASHLLDSTIHSGRDTGDESDKAASGVHEGEAALAAVRQLLRSGLVAQGPKAAAPSSSN